MSTYSRALSCLLIYRYDLSNLKKIANYYLKSKVEDSILRKYIIFVSLTIENVNLREKVLNKARTDQDLSISRLINLIDNMKLYKDLNEVKNFLKRSKVVIAYNKEPRYIVELEAKQIRQEIMQKLLDIYS